MTTPIDLYRAAVAAGLEMPQMIAGADPSEVWTKNPFEGYVHAPTRHASLADVEASVQDALAVKQWFPLYHAGANQWQVLHIEMGGNGAVLRTVAHPGPTRASAMLAACVALGKP